MTPAEKMAASRKKKPLRPLRAAGVHRCQLRNLRHELGLTIRDVAEGIEMSTAGFHAVESGADVRLTTMRKLAAFFGKTIDEIWPPEAT